jgi:hypothetical protein
MSGIIAVRTSGPVAARNVETFILASGAAFDVSGDVALNTAHRGLVGGENPHNTVLTAADIGEAIAAADPKATPIDADSLGLSDSEDSGILKKLTFDNLLIWVRSVFKFITGQYDITTTYTPLTTETVTLDFSLGNSFIIDVSAFGAGGSLTIGTPDNLPTGETYPAFTVLIIAGANLPTFSWANQPGDIDDPEIVASKNNEIIGRRWPIGTDIVYTIGQSFA